MAVLSDDMGGITAYAAAVNRGYTGTKEEFEQLMYSYTEVAERAEAAAGNAHESEEATIEAKDIAVGAKNEAVSARDVAISARDASISAKNNSESARDAAISAKDDTLAAKDAVMSAKSDVDETSANFSEEVTAAISDVNAAGRNQKELAKTHAVDSEAWAVGQREGADVGVSDETYHNNSKYYAEQSALAKSETETARDTAITAKNDAVSAKNEAETAKGEAQDIVDGINAKSEQIDQNAEDISALQTAMETKAEIDGYYEDMTVGDAEQLVSSKYVGDSEPYLYRTSGGSKDIGNREYVDAIVGGTVCWNQVFQKGSVNYSGNGYTLTSNNDGEFTVNVTADTATQGTSVNHTDIYLPYTNHVYAFLADSSLITVYLKGAQKESNKIFISGSKYNNVVFMFENLAQGTYKVHPQLFDLTAMFGSTIADYIYSLEQATAGAGVTFFKKLFPNDYYPFNAGELRSVEGVSSHDMVGFNLFDEVWEKTVLNPTGGVDAIDGRRTTKNFIRILPNTQYCIKLPQTGRGRGAFYNSDKSLISYYADFPGTGAESVFPNNGDLIPATDGVYFVFVTPANAQWFKYSAPGINTANVCINLSWSGWRNGEYEPYVKHSYPLDSSLTLRGIPKLDANNNLYYDGDKYSPNGMVVRNWWFETFDGSQTVYTVTTVGDYTRFVYKLAKTASVAGINGYPGYPECLCSSLPYLLSFTNESEHYYCNQTDVIFFMLTSKVGSTSESVSNYVYTHPIQLLYRIATPIIEEAEPYAYIQICDDFGTDEYVSTGIVPVGHETRYPANLRDKLQHLPDLADDDGYYMISQQNKNMSLELFRIPKAPTTDGAYTLKATVSGGTPTYTWEAEE